MQELTRQASLETMYSTWAIKVRIPGSAEKEEEPEPHYYEYDDEEDDDF